MSRVLDKAIGFFFALSACGCMGDAPSSPPPSNAPAQQSIVSQIMRISPPLRDQRFSSLLDFETDADAVFLAAKPVGRVVSDRAHTGRGSIRLAPGTTRFAIKLSSLLGDRAFPGDWTLIGAYFYSEQPIQATLSIEGAGFNVAPRSVPLSPRAWTLALADISENATKKPRSESPAPAGAQLVFTFPQNAPPIWCDDLILIDNAKTFVARPVPATAPAVSTWTVERKGLNYIAEAPGRFNFQLITAEAANSGWTAEEANELRARFQAHNGKNHLTIYSDGRAFWDGKLRAMSAMVRDEPAYAEQHASPAEIYIAEELGRVRRDTPGDANNDGYNELRGAYQVAATGARLELTITPHTASLLRPILEVTGLPPGKVLVTAEGRLVEKMTRTDDGTLIVELPLKIEKPTTVNLRIQ